MAGPHLEYLPSTSPEKNLVSLPDAFQLAVALATVRLEVASKPRL
jgi:hypothetical protein